MPSITVKMKDGTRREFPHKGRAGGSWTKTLRYEIGFVVITDEYGNETAIPSADIEEIITHSNRY
jgi:hypothetical protein